MIKLAQFLIFSRLLLYIQPQGRAVRFLSKIGAYVFRISRKRVKRKSKPCESFSCIKGDVIRPEVCPWVSSFPISGFLQIPPRDGHPCLRLYPSHYRADLGLAPLRNVRRQAHQTKQRRCAGNTPPHAGAVSFFYQFYHLFQLILAEILICEIFVLTAYDQPHRQSQFH